MYPYTQNTGSLISVIKAISAHGVPDKFTSRELPIWGFKSSNDRNIPSVLKFIGMLDGSGIPQELWKLARTEPEKATAKGLKTGYSDLFGTFPDAHRKDAEALNNFFKAKTTVGDAVVKQMVATFRALAQFSDFESPIKKADDADEDENGSVESGVQSTITSRTVSPRSGLTVNLNIELSVPSDTTGDVYDKFFAAMKKHLIDPA